MQQMGRKQEVRVCYTLVWGRSEPIVSKGIIVQTTTSISNISQPTGGAAMPDEGLNGPAISNVVIGLAVGCGVLLFLCLCLVSMACRRRRKRVTVATMVHA